jgi:16S rRNA (guanine527-N7)-methyltransferase
MPLTFDWQRLPELFPEFESPAAWLPRLQRHWALIEAAAARVQVTSVSADQAVMRHYAESLELLSILERIEPLTMLVDVGSGGGFPGFVIAAVRPDLDVHLVEPLKKRATLLSEMAGVLGLRHVHVHPLRAEEAARGPLRETSPVVTARAVAPLSPLLEYTAPFGVPGCLIVLPKGSGFEQELASATVAMAELAVEYVGIAPMRKEISATVRVALFRKRASTPAKYPRRSGAAARRPL